MASGFEYLEMDYVHTKLPDKAGYLQNGFGLSWKS